ncbi:MAG: PEP-CTERM sorting domain-containing protein [Limnothrix sp.]|nr:PEP-CTERM sorting domain-containing protein [Limnothrix sp.]
MHKIHLSLVSLLTGATVWTSLAPISLAGSMITGTTPGTPVTPSTVNVFLEPEDPLTFRVEVETKAPPELDVFLLNDLSGSFGDDLPNVRASVPGLLSGLSSISSSVRFGLGSFVDKPIAPFGWADTADYVYNTDLALGSDGSALQTAVNGLAIRFGSDEPESQLEALFQVALRSKSEIGFRDSAFKAVILQTDASYHKAGDGTSVGLIPNNGDANIDANEDYPFVEQVRKALLDSGIVPIFAATTNVTSIYQDLVSQLGFGQVVTLSADSSNLVDAVQTGIKNALSDVKLFVESDDYNYVRQIASDISGEKTGTDLDVPAGDRAKFDVTLRDLAADGRGKDDTLYLTATGYGRTTVNVSVPSESVSVPEPGTILGLGLFALGGLATTRRQQKQ